MSQCWGEEAVRQLDLRVLHLHSSASMYPAISVSDILGLPFKHPGKQAEEKIVSLIQEARAKRANSKSLLERAKRAVEISIEESKETALAYLDGKHYLADELLPKLFSPSRYYIDLATVQRTIKAESIVYEDATHQSLPPRVDPRRPHPRFRARLVFQPAPRLSARSGNAPTAGT